MRDEHGPRRRPTGAAHPRDELAALTRTRSGLPWSAHPGLDAAGGRPAAVLVLFGVLDSVPAAHRSTAVPADLDVLLVERASTLRHHAGQISFPGGRIDPGDDGPVAAALREAVEETGLDPGGVEVLGLLPELPMPVSDHRVRPVVAWWRSPSAVAVVDVGESAAVFRAPVADLVDPANRRTATLTRDAGAYRGPAFVLDDHLVWGFTALVLDGVLDALGWAEPWDRDAEVAVQV